MDGELTTGELPSLAAFNEALGSAFQLQFDRANSCVLELIEVSPSPIRPVRNGAAPVRGEPFSIVFRGPFDVRISQRIYRFAHDRLGSFDLFIVPVGPDDQGQRYEAVFN